MFEVYKEKLKPMAGGRSTKTGRRLQVGINTHTPWPWVIFCFTENIAVEATEFPPCDTIASDTVIR
jgi:hypothetical protein